LGADVHQIPIKAYVPERARELICAAAAGGVAGVQRQTSTQATCSSLRRIIGKLLE